MVYGAERSNQSEVLGTFERTSTCALLEGSKHADLLVPTGFC